MANLLLCPDCTRFFRSTEELCPFCGAAAGRASQRRAAILPSGSSRSRCYVAGVAVVAASATFACTDDRETTSTGAESPTDAVGTETDRDEGTDSSTDGDGTDMTDGEDDGGGSTSDDTTDVDGSSDTELDELTDELDNTDAETTDAEATDGAEQTDDVDMGLGGAGGMACPGYEERDLTLHTTCITTADCLSSGAGTICAQAQIYETVGNDPCRFDFSSCPPDCAGECVAVECGEICVPWCDETTCNGTAYCVDETTCGQKPCDMEGAAECNPGFACQPDLAFADARGCAVLSCDEPDGNDCPAGMACRPSGDLANNQGCEPIACDEAGAPECNEGFVCRPASAFAQQSLNQFGCAPLRCDDPGGPECQAGTYCNPDSETSAIGCDVTPCDAGWDCDPWRECSPGAMGADAHGCIDHACTDHTDCGCGYCFDGVCSPTEGICVTPEVVATPYGCVWPDDEFV